MHEYDVALKLLLRASTDTMLRQLTGVHVARWLNPELPQVQTSRADLLGITDDGQMVHLELQASNDPDMAVRMAEYAPRIYRQFRKYPKQTVLYVGVVAMRMPCAWQEPVQGEPDLMFRYNLLDIRDVDGAELLKSSQIEENLLAILTRLPDPLARVREILARIAKLKEPARRAAFAQFLIISSSRRLAPAVKEESQKMPILNDILDHEVIGPAILQGLQQGRQEGRLQLLQRLLENRFGPLPHWAAARLADTPASKLEEIAVRLFDARRLEDLF